MRGSGFGVCTAGAVEETVAGLDGVVDLNGAGVIVDFPETEAHEGHLIAVVQLDGRGNHCECVDSNLVLVVFRAKNWND